MDPRTMFCEDDGALQAMKRKINDAEVDKAVNDILEHFAAEDRRHARKLKTIRWQGYAMQALIWLVFLGYIFLPLFF